MVILRGSKWGGRVNHRLDITHELKRALGNAILENEFVVCALGIQNVTT